MADILQRIDKVADTIDKVTSHIEVKPVVTSISSQAAKSTYYFPVLISKNVSPSTATMLSTNLEYMYAYFMRACFALTPAIRVNGDVNVEEYLKRFHQNVGINRNQFGIVLREDFEEFKLLPNDSLNEAFRAPGAPDAKVLDEAISPSDKKFNKKIKTINKGVDDVVDAATKINDTLDEVKSKADAVKGFYDKCNENKARWDVGNIDKKNAMAPTTMVVTCTMISDVKGDKDSKPVEIPVVIPIGIKTVIHGVDPIDLNDRLVDLMNGRGVIKALVRWSSGEVESLGDMLFGTTQMKKNIAGGSDLDRWFDVIERRKRINKLTLGLSSKKPFLPNMTIHISMDDVNDIERKTKINLLKNINAAQRLIKDCFLLAFIITDDAYETAYILYDGHSDFEDVPYSTIKRDSEKQSSAIDNLAKVLSK